VHHSLPTVVTPVATTSGSSKAGSMGSLPATTGAAAVFAWPIRHTFFGPIHGLTLVVTAVPCEECAVIGIRVCASRYVLAPERSDYSTSEVRQYGAALPTHRRRWNLMSPLRSFSVS